ncbi:hypothetical protein FVER14953_10350 [Fusarium verticillioides]|nr:hypothetical protein FVER14953_10350 [Fusarium verticillioides]
MSHTRTIFQLDSQPTWFENITLRLSGTILATRLDVPEIWEIDPEKSTGFKILRIPLPDDIPNPALTGICCLKPDVFAVAAGSFDMIGGAKPKPGSWSIWVADLAGEQAKVTKIADMPEIGMINGIATWNENTALVTDCLYGKVYKLSVATGSCNVTLEDDTFTIPADAPFQVGLNGIKIHRFSEQTHVYYTATSRFCVYRVPVTQEAQAAGPVETLAPGLVADDFAVAHDGTMYVCTNISTRWYESTLLAETLSWWQAKQRRSTSQAQQRACLVRTGEFCTFRLLEQMQCLWMGRQSQRRSLK